MLLFYFRVPMQAIYLVFLDEAAEKSDEHPYLVVKEAGEGAAHP